MIHYKTFHSFKLFVSGHGKKEHLRAYRIPDRGGGSFPAESKSRKRIRAAGSKGEVVRKKKKDRTLSRDPVSLSAYSFSRSMVQMLQCLQSISIGGSQVRPSFSAFRLL